jgi:hypothetical protein|tara:strand:- start:771 stop:1070 length:300 start_codon:yes stop_codon:yes gene_type:complete
MQTDVLASVPITSSGQFTDQATNNIARCRVKSIYIVPSATAGSLILRDGGSGGAIKATINTVASASQPTYMLMPGEGLLFQTAVYGAVTNLGSATIIYG